MLTSVPMPQLRDVPERWDVIVIGAGPAGALTAHEVARRGAAVLLVDKQHFPRAKVCGCCLNGRALATLATCGLENLVTSRGGTPLRSVQLAARRRATTLPLPAGASLSRGALDTALAKAAQERGAVFLPGTTAQVGDTNA